MTRIIPHMPKKISLKKINVMQSLKLYRFEKATLLFLAFGIFFLLNFVFSYVSLRFDFSRGQAYTLSQSTKKLAANLTQDVTITLYTSDNIPARIQPITREALDLLREYERASGKIALEIKQFRPQEDEDVVKTLSDLGIAGIPVREQEQGEVSVTQIFFAAVMKSAEKEEPIPQALDIENLEYALTSSLYRLTTDSLPRVGIIGADTPFMAQQDALSAFKQVAGGLFTLEPITPPLADEAGEASEKKPLFDEGLKALMVFDHAQGTFDEATRREISTFMEKHHTIFFLDGRDVDENSLAVASPSAGLIELLRPRGVAVQEDLLLSDRAEMVNLGGGFFSVMIPYPFWLWTTDFAEGVGYFSGISRLTFPWASSVKATDTAGEGVRILAHTSGQSWRQTESFELNPQDIPDPRDDDMGRFGLIAEHKNASGAKTMAIGSSRFLMTNYLARDSQNIEFIINVLSDYASDGALSGIGRRTVSLYPLPNIPKSQQEAFKYLNMLGIPALFALAGGVHLYRRMRAS